MAFLANVRLVFIVYGLALATLVSCSTSNSPSQTPKASLQTLSMTLGASPQTIDPHQVTGLPGITIIAALYENLLGMDYQTMTPKAAVAERWERLDGGLKYRFYLREHAKWSNGDPVTAHDFVFSWQRMLSPGLGNQFATEYYFIKNAEAYNTGEINDPSKLGVRAVSNSILEFQLSRRDPTFIGRVALPQTSPVHRATIEKYGKSDDPSNPWVQPGHHVGNGPFTLIKWELNKVIKVGKSLSYWDANNILLDAISFNPAESEVLEERLFRSKQVQLTFGRRIPVEKIAVYKKQHPEQIFSQVDYATYLYMFNTQKPPFDNIDVRRAFAYSIDRALITQGVTKNGESVALALTPLNHAYSPPNIQGYNPKKAKALLAKAGYPNGVGFPKVTLMFNALAIHTNIAVAIQQMWKKVLNIDVSLENQEWKVFLNSRQNLDHHIARSGLTGLLADPIDLLAAFTTGHGSNDTGWSNLDYDKLIAQSNAAVDPEERYRILFEAESILLNELPILPIFYYTSTYLKATEVKGFEFNMVSQPNYKGVYIESPNE